MEGASALTIVPFSAFEASRNPENMGVGGGPCGVRARSAPGHHCARAGVPQNPHQLVLAQLRRRQRAAAVSAVAPAPVWVAGSILGGAAGTPFVVKATNSWYSDPTVLKLPSWTPPNKVFMPVWTMLYGLIGLTGYRAAVNSALPGLAVGHYIANLAWAPLFFGLKKLKLAAALQFGLLGSLAAVWSSFKKDARLLIPYAAWLSYATVLNLAICRLNPAGVQTVEDRTPTGVAALY